MTVKLKGAKQKGTRGELEFAKLLAKDFGAQVKRTPQSGGWWDLKGDVITRDFPLSEWHFEVKFQERISIWQWIAQVLTDTAGTLKYRALVFRRSRSSWWVAMPYSDWAEVVKERAELKEKS